MFKVKIDTTSSAMHNLGDHHFSLMCVSTYISSISLSTELSSRLNYLFAFNNSIINGYMHRLHICIYFIFTEYNLYTSTFYSTIFKLLTHN